MAVVFVLGDGTEVTGHPSPLVRVLVSTALAAGLRDAALAARLVELAPAAAGEILAGLLAQADEPAPAPEAAPPAAKPRGPRGPSVASIMAALGKGAVIEEGPPRER